MTPTYTMLMVTARSQREAAAIAEELASGHGHDWPHDRLPGDGVWSIIPPVDISSPTEDGPPTSLGVFDAEGQSDEFAQTALAGDDSGATVAAPTFVMVSDTAADGWVLERRYSLARNRIWALRNEKSTMKSHHVYELGSAVIVAAASIGAAREKADTLLRKDGQSVRFGLSWIRGIVALGKIPRSSNLRADKGCLSCCGFVQLHDGQGPSRNVLAQNAIRD
jgi:hypothetical protein